jgi:hypothetical protein
VVTQAIVSKAGREEFEIRDGWDSRKGFPEAEAANRKFQWPADGTVNAWAYYDHGSIKLGLGDRFFEETLVEWRDPNPAPDVSTVFFTHWPGGTQAVLEVERLRIYPARFLLVGGKGQRGGTGGLLDYKPKDGEFEKKDRAPVTLEMLKEHIALVIAHPRGPAKHDAGRREGFRVRNCGCQAAAMTV